jgi:thiamine phosphate synthase YjbQ (UPF0047 family)
MPIFEKEITFGSTLRTYAARITPVINKVLEELNTSSGIVTLESMHTTCGFNINEGQEPNFLLDIVEVAQIIVPEDRRSTWVIGKDYPYPTLPYRHFCGDNRLLLPGEVENESNAARHIRDMALANPTLQRSYRNGKLRLGRFQDILLLEFDGRDGSDGLEKRERTLMVTVDSYESPIISLPPLRLPPNLL